MDIKEYAALVERMRNYQKEYFRTKATLALVSSKKLEKSVDESTEIILAKGIFRNQTTLGL